MRPDLSTVPSFYHGYINQVKEDELTAAFDDQSSSFLRFLEAIPSSKVDYRYAEGKWTIKEMLQHIIDAERVFAYRALVFARKDTVSLPPFDENEYAANSKAANRQWEDMVEEFRQLRESSKRMFASFDEEQLDSSGVANNNRISVRAIGFVMVGHALHHMKVLQERYLN